MARWEPCGRCGSREVGGSFTSKDVVGVIVLGLAVLFFGTAYIHPICLPIGAVIILIGIAGPIRARNELQCRNCGRKWKRGSPA